MVFQRESEITAVMVSAITDHVLVADGISVEKAVGTNEVGGGRRCTMEEIERLISLFPGQS